MTISELLQYCMAKPGAEQSVHNDWKATQIKVEDVLFAMVKEVENRPAVSLKTSPELAELLRQQHSDVRPSRHLNKAHWSTVYLDDAPRDKCTLSCAINGIHAAFHYLKKNYISGCVMTVPTG